MGKAKLPQGQVSTLRCRSCQTRDDAEWCVLATADVVTLDLAKVTRNYRSGELIYAQGDPCQGIFCIESGNVAVRKTDSDGGSKILRLAHAGQTLGYADFFGSRGYNGSAEALDHCQICHVNSDILRKLLAVNPKLGMGFLTHAAQDLRDADETGMQQSLYSIRMRLAHLLLILKDRYARVEDDGTIRLSLPMSRQDIAAMLGARPETIYRTIHQMERDKIVTFTGHDVIIPDLDLLLDEIEGEAVPS